jgi:coproporphyrinogen III oxidase-like Fe-S oxidoreductase
MKGVRSINDEKPASYMDKIEKGLSPIESEESLAGKAKIGESFMLGLRLVHGFKPSRLMLETFDRELLDLESRHLLTIDEQGFVALTRDGLFLANDVFREFVPPFRAERVTP